MKTWVKESIFYQIFILGFCGALDLDNIYDEKNRLIKVEKWIPYLKSININAIYFSPIFEASYHGYDTKDYYNVDKRLGTNEDFKNLCNKLHDNNIKIVLDGVFNHVGREFWAFEDVRKNGQNSKYCDWFDGLNFYSKSPMGDEFNYNSWNGCYDLVKLNLKNQEVINHILGAVEFWINEFDIDGLRLDAADCIDFDFFKVLKKFTTEKKKDFWLMGEVIHGDYNRWANPDSLDSVTNYECYKGIYSSHNDKNYFEIAYSLNRLFGDGGLYKNLYLYNFVDNHDVNRIASTLKKREYISNVYTILYTMPGVPSIYYGSEVGIEGVKSKGRDTDLPLRPELELEYVKNNNKELSTFIRNLGKIRTSSNAIKYGDYKQVVIKNEQFVYCRTLENEKVYILLNLSDQESYLEFDLNIEHGKDLLDDKSELINGGRVNILVEPFSSKIISNIF